MTTLRIPASYQPYLLAYLLVAFILAMFAVATWGNPYRNENYTSGRYLPVPLQITDARLFQNDVLVATWGRLRTFFYEGIGHLHRWAKASPERLEKNLTLIYLTTRLLILVGLALLARKLLNDWWFLIVLVAWACHMKTTYVGGVTLFQPTLTHVEAVFAFELFALSLLVSKRLLPFWLMLCVGVFFHSIVLFHLVLCLVPYFLSEYREKAHWIGGALFVACCLIYMATLAPPRLTHEEGRIFLNTDWYSSHFNFLKFKAYHATSLFGLVAVSMLAQRQFLRSQRALALFAQSALFGAVVAISFSVVTVITRSASLALFQPLRVFFWIVFFCYVVLIAATTQAFKTRLSGGLFLSGTLVLLAFDSRWAPVMLMFTLVYLVAREVMQRWDDAPWAQFETFARLFFGGLASVIVLGWLGGKFMPFASLRAFLLVPPALIALWMICFDGRWPNLRPLAAVLLLAYGLTVATRQSYEFFAERNDADWEEIRRWSRNHSQPEDWFITPPDKPNFRALAWRSTRSEPLLHLVWIEPRVYQQVQADAERAARGYSANSSDIPYLMSLAKEWQCKYVIARGPLPAGYTAQGQAGPYSVLAVN